MSAKLPTARSLALAALRDFRRHFRAYLAVIAIVAVPVNLLLLLPTLADDPTITAYTSFAYLAMNLALIWSIVHVVDSGTRITLKRAYYDGTAPMIRFVLVSLLLALLSIPASIGLYLIGMGSDPLAAPSLGERVFVLLLAAIFALPTIFAFVRLMLAPYAVVARSLTPRSALADSWNATRGRFWRTFRYALAMLLLVFGIAAIPTIIYTLLLIVVPTPAFLGLFQLLLTMTVLPFIHLYLYRVYLALSAARPAGEGKAVAVD